MNTAILPGDSAPGEIGDLRVFVGMPLPADLVKAIGEMQERLRSVSKRSVRWVEPETLHLTIEFLGDVPRWVVADLPAALDDAIAGARPIALTTTTLGAFPNWGKPKVVWIGIGGAVVGLTALRKRVSAALRSLGFPADPRPFQPHLTIGRLRSDQDTQAIDRLRSAAQTDSIAPVPFTLDEVALYRSVLRADGPEHFALDSWTLGKT